MHASPASALSVAVIGAGPGGSVAALILARAGLSVTLIEQHRFPRDKVCGESISALGMEVLRRHQLAGAILSAGAVEMTRAALHAPDGVTLSLPLPKPMWGLSRRSFDAILLNAAGNAGATLLQPARCESLQSTPSPITLVVRDLVSNTLCELCPDWVILADGKRALLPLRFPPTDDFGVKGHFAAVDAPRDAVELFGVHGCYGGTAPIENDTWNVAFSFPKSRLASHGGNLDALFAEMRTENIELYRRFKNARKISPWLSAPLPRFSAERQSHPRILAIGNAAAAIEPIGGEGTGLAMRSAELAAEAIIQSRNDYAAMTDLPRQFTKLWRTRRWGCRLIAKLLSNPMLASWSLDAATHIPALHRSPFNCWGKTD